MARYIIKEGKFGKYFHDSYNSKDLSLDEVCSRLNKHTKIEISEQDFDKYMLSKSDDVGYVNRMHVSSYSYRKIKEDLGF
jgi:hypothetical protein